MFLIIDIITMLHVSIRHVDKGKPSDNGLGTGVVITIGVVTAAVLASIVAIIVTIFCVVKKKWLIDYELKRLAINDTEEYIKRLQEQIKSEKRAEVLTELINLMTVASERLLNCVAPSMITPVVTISTQTSVQPPTRRESNENSIQVQVQQEPNHVVNINDSDDQSKHAQEEPRKEGKALERPKVSFQRKASMEAMEPVDLNQSANFHHLTHLFAAFISKAVRDSLLYASESNPTLAHKVEKEVRHAMFQRQQSIASSGASYLDGDCSMYTAYKRSESEC